MAKRMNLCRQAAGRQRRRRAAGFLGLFLAASAVAGFAAALRDPTAPPQLGRAGRPGHIAVPHLPVLESVLLLPGYKAAIIDGQTVMLGSLFKGARLVALTAQTARLRKGASTRVLHLAPAAAATGLETAPAAAALEKTK